MPRNRNQPAVIAPLTVEQETTLGNFGNLLTGERGESNLETLARLFGTAEAAATGWFDHRDVLMAEDPVAGRRPCGYWLFEQQREPPPSAEQAAILRELGELSEREEQQLEAWVRRVPETPRDLGLDHVAIDPITDPSSATPPTTPTNLEELPHAIDAPPEPPRTAPTEADNGSGISLEGPEAEDAGEERAADAEIVVSPPRILPIRRYGPDDRRPAELEGWE